MQKLFVGIGYKTSSSKYTINITPLKHTFKTFLKNIYGISENPTQSSLSVQPALTSSADG